MAAPHYGALGGGVPEPQALDRVAWAEPTPALPHSHPALLLLVRRWHGLAWRQREGALLLFIFHTLKIEALGSR